jgi:hemolysin activation/secretion protein
MSLLKLSPEATRLRRIAKACAAGEVSRSEYRQARREVIEKFTSSTEVGVEDTVPRFALDITQRRYELPAESTPAVSRQNGLTWMLLVALALAALSLPLFSWAAPRIGPVNERDPNPLTAPRFNVATIQVATVQAPSFELLPATLVQQLQEQMRDSLAAVKKANAPADHGFSDAELLEVGRFLNALGVHDKNVQLTRRDLQDLTALIATQKSQRGVSLVQLEQIAADLQLWLRAQGYPLARVYIPVQTVSDDVVDFALELGVLADVRVAQATNLDVQYSMSTLLGKPVQREAVETKLNVLNRALGIQAQASFTPGESVGETQMLLHLKNPRRFSGAVGLDNYAVEDLGEERLYLSGQWNNPRGVGDVLSAKGFSSLDPADHQYAQIGYQTPVLAGRYELKTQLAFADISLDQGVPFDGDGMLFDAHLRQTRLFTRSHRNEIYYRVGVHDFNWDLVDDQQAWFVGVGVDGHRVWDTQKIALTANVEALVGGVDEQRQGQDSSFWRLTAGLNAWTPLQLPWLDVRAKLIFDLQWQGAADLLPPTLRMNTTGPFANQGFSQASVLLDQGVTLGGALRFDAPIGQWWMFVDATYGEQEGDRSRWRELTSAGLGWEGQLIDHAQGRLLSRITLGLPLTHDGTQGLDDDGTQIYWSVRYEY